MALSRAVRPRGGTGPITNALPNNEMKRTKRAMAEWRGLRRLSQCSVLTNAVPFSNAVLVPQRRSLYVPHGPGWRLPHDGGRFPGTAKSHSRALDTNDSVSRKTSSPKRARVAIRIANMFKLSVSGRRVVISTPPCRAPLQVGHRAVEIGQVKSGGGLLRVVPISLLTKLATDRK